MTTGVSEIRISDTFLPHSTAANSEERGNLGIVKNLQIDNEDQNELHNRGQGYKFLLDLLV